MLSFVIAGEVQHSFRQFLLLPPLDKPCDEFFYVEIVAFVYYIYIYYNINIVLLYYKLLTNPSDCYYN